MDGVVFYIYLRISFIRNVKFGAVERGTFTLIRYLFTLRLLYELPFSGVHTTNVAPKIPNVNSVRTNAYDIYLRLCVILQWDNIKQIFIENFQSPEQCSMQQKEDVDLFSV